MKLCRGSGGGGIGGLLSSAVGSLLGGLGGGGGAPLSSPIPVPRSLAHGGPAFAGRPIKVHANETFIPPVNGRILTAAQSERMGRGDTRSTPIININNFSNEPIQTDSRRQGGVDLHTITVGAVGDGLGKGELDGPLKSRFDIQPKRVAR